MKDRIKNIYQRIRMIRLPKLRKISRPSFLRSNIFISVFVSLLILVLTGVISFAAVYTHRAEIFSYFAKEYIASQIASEQHTEQGKTATSSDALAINMPSVIQNIFTNENKIPDMVERVDPAVVSIVVTKEVPVYEQYYQSNGYFSIPQYRQNGTKEQEVGEGSGFLVSSDGLIVTNRHVVSDTDATYAVYTKSGEKYDATVVARDSYFDIAVVKIKTNKALPYLSLGNSDNLRTGETVVAIGNALGEFRNSVSVGVVSGLSRSITAGDSYSGESEQLEQVIQTDAAINPGNSGGPLLNTSGEVVGVDVAVAEDSQNIGFAIPINTIKPVIESVKQNGKIIYPFLGVRYVQVNDAVKAKYNLTVDYGVLLAAGSGNNEPAIEPGSPAATAGLKDGDVVLEADGIKLDGTRSLSSIIRNKKIGDILVLKISRDAKELILTAILKASSQSS